MPIPMSAPSAPPPPPQDPNAPPPQDPGAASAGDNSGLDKAVAAVGTGLQKLSDAISQSNVPDDVKSKFADALDAFSQAAQGLMGGGAQDNQSGTASPDQGSGGQPMTQQMKGM